MTTRRSDAVHARGVGLVISFGVALVALAVVLIAHGRPGEGGIAAPGLGVLVVVTLGFVLAEALVCNLQVRDETYTFSVSEVPFVVGLAVLSPAGLVLARLIGGGVTGLRRRVPPYKLFFNLCLFAFEAALASWLVGRAGEIVGMGTAVMWPVLGAAVLVAGVVNASAIAVAISLFDPTAFRRVMVMAARSQVLYVVNASLGVLVAIAAVESLWLTLVGLLPIVALWGAGRLYETLQKKYEHLESLHVFTGTVGQAGDDVMAVAMLELQRILNIEFVEVRLVPVGDAVALRSTLGDDGRTVASALDPDAERALIAGHERSARIVVDPIAFAEVLGGPVPAGWREAIVVPIPGERGAVIGVVIASNRRGTGASFQRDDVTLLASLVNHLAAVFQSTLLHRRLHQSALTDALTGLANRAAFEAAHSAESPLAPDVAVALVAMNRFDEIIETLGRAGGDVLLQTVAERLVATVGGAAEVARIGDTEFAVAFADVASDLDAQRWIERLVGALHPPVELDGVTVNVNATVGMARADDGDLDLSTLLGNADRAVANARRDDAPGGLAQPHHRGDGRRKLVLGAALRSALRDGHLVVRYQPKIEIAHGTVVGAEALVRWNHPDYGPIPPPEIIELAERDSLIRELTDYVIRAALAEVAVWRALGHRHLHVAVNLSPRDLHDRGLGDAVDAMLRAAGMPAHALELEVTESGIMHDTDRAIAVLQDLRDRGIRLSVDDYGTGYSSLAYLKRLPVDYLKIDKSFVMGLGSDDDDSVIVRSTIDLGHDLGLQVVAEGVETAEVLAHLGRLGCDIAQGYLLTAPLPAEDFRRWLRESGRCPVAGPGAVLDDVA